MKKVLILDTGKEWGGGTNSLIELLKRIDKKRYGFSALFYSNYRMGSGPDVKSELEKLGAGFSVLERGENPAWLKPLKEAGRALLFPSAALKKRYVFRLDYIGRIVPDSKRIESFLREGGFDLLYMNNQPSSNLEGILAAKAAKVPAVQHSRIEVRLNKVEAEAVNSNAARVICVSRGVMDGLVESGVRADKCVVVYNGIDGTVKPKRSPEEVRRDLGIKEGTTVIGTVGSLIKRKRVDLLLRAFPAVKGIEGTVCLVVGDGAEMDSLKKTTRDLGLADRVIFTGFSADALSFINAMDLFVSASEKEGLPRVVLEAMLMGKSVVAFDIIGTREIVVNEKTGLLVREECAQALGAAIDGLLGKRKALEAFGKEGRKRVLEEFGIDRYVSGVERVFKEVLG
ncbi:MAG: glycosyltransferase family 4 protein [Deltaproteobacteria bacterium]|nr:glycosyltransferase family 4 protein [Deltaproteobacteria bacterium]